MVSIIPINSIGVAKTPYQGAALSARSEARDFIENDIEKKFPWIRDRNIMLALNELKNIVFDPNETALLKKSGVNLPFNSGAEAVQFLKNSNARIIFDKMEPEVHAQYDFAQNFVKINSAYRNTLDTAVILAISEAILHEAGHAKDSDNESSVQEEINCLGMNALAHRYLQRKYPHIFQNSESRIIQDGVSVYEKLFFDDDPNKIALIQRLQMKYGYLPAGDIKHYPSTLAARVKNSI